MTNTNTRSYLIWGGFILGTIVLLFVLAKLGTKGVVVDDQNAGKPIAGTKLSEAVNDSDHIKGNKDGAVTVVEYSDFQCPSCRAAMPLVKQLEKELGDKVAIVYRHYPLSAIHANAQLAAQAAEAAHIQGKFWEMHDELFNSQDSWSKTKNPTDLFVKMAEKLKLDKNQFKTDLVSEVVKLRVDKDYASGSASGVRGTPTFYINGQQITNPGTYATLKSAVESKLGGGSTDTAPTATTTVTKPKVKSAN